MENFNKEIIAGRKTFFIAVDRSMFPESYLEEYLALGYECYFIDSDIFIPIERKVEVILSMFEDSILFFNIDSHLQGEDWPTFIQRLQEENKNAYFGVLYGKRKTETEKQNVERLYTQEIGLKCGCIQLEYQKKNNFGIVERALFLNKAMGRRKNVRAVLKSSCSIQFVTQEGYAVNTKLKDISVSHFSILLENKLGIEIKEYEKILKARLFVNGFHFESDAILIMKRADSENCLYVFAFCNEQGQFGTAPYIHQSLVKKIYSIMQDNCRGLLELAYRDKH